jgi:hypothetical protein
MNIIEEEMILYPENLRLKVLTSRIIVLRNKYPIQQANYEV